MRGCSFLLVLSLALAIGMPRAAATPAADGAVDDAVARAEKLYLEGATLYRARRYLEAVQIFERAYRVYPEPNLLYNMGRCYEAMGQPKDAIERYQRFVADNRSAAKAKAKARAKIALLSQILAKTRVDDVPAKANPPSEAASTLPSGVASNLFGPPASAVPSSREAQPSAPPSTDGDRFSVSKWLVGITGVALAGGGVALFFLGHADHQEVQDAIDAAGGGVVTMPQAEAAVLIDDGERKKLIGYALMGAGGVALITSVVLFALGGENEAVDAPSSMHMALMPGGAMIGVGGRF